MRNYPPTWGTPKRLRQGRRLARGLARTPETTPLIPLIDGPNAALEAAYTACAALLPAVDACSDDLHFAEYTAERDARRTFHLARTLDGDRTGAVTRVGFPDGLTVVLATSGENQIKAFREVRTAYAESHDPTVAAHRADLLAPLDRALDGFSAAYAAWVAAVSARDAAFSVERLRRREHRRAFNAIFGGIRAAFPDDRELQDALVPALPAGGRSTAADGDESDDGDGEPTPDEA